MYVNEISIIIRHSKRKLKKIIGKIYLFIWGVGGGKGGWGNGPYF